MGKEVLEELRNKKRMYHLWKETQVSQEVFKGAARACRRKIREGKALFELKLATSVKDNKNIFTNIFMVKGRVSLAFVLYWMREKISNCR